MSQRIVRYAIKYFLEEGEEHVAEGDGAEAELGM